MKKFIWLIRNSIILDIKFIFVSQWSFLKKIHFLLKKYLLILKHFYKKFYLGKDYSFWNGKKIFYDSRYGFTDYQSILSRHQRMLKIAHVERINVIMDIGANVGFFSLLCRDLFPSSKIYSFEPIPQIFSCLKRNFKNDSLTHVFNIALGDKKEKQKMDFDENDSVISKLNSSGSVEVNIETLDRVVLKNNIAFIDILKIDTETFEHKVLKGASEALKKTRYLFIEITMKDNNNYTISSLMKLLCTDQYEFQLVAFRNYADKGEGDMPIMDALLKNIRYDERNL